MNILLLRPDETILSAGDRRFLHIRDVLRLGVGDRLRAGIVNGPSGYAVIEEMDRRHARIRFNPESGEEVEPGGGLHDRSPADRPLRGVTLLLGHPRPIVLGRLLRDLCTVGLERLIVVPTRLGEKSYLGATIWRDLSPYLVDGAAQAGVTRLTTVEREATLAAGIRSLGTGCASRFVLDTGAGGSLERALGGPGGGPVALAVGSERGWTESEVGALTDAGFTAVSLGPRILRTETAAVVACWMAANGGTAPAISE